MDAQWSCLYKGRQNKLLATDQEGFTYYILSNIVMDITLIQM
jgi:hypothetical protein